MAKDFYHEQVKAALRKEGWQITHDPYPLSVGAIGYEVDLGAEKLIAAEKDKEKIAVEIKGFFQEVVIQKALQRIQVKIIVYNPHFETIVTWIK